VAINVLDVRDTFAPSHVPTRRPVLSVIPAAPTDSSTVTPFVRPRHAPLPVWAAATLGILQALGLMATALTGVDKILGSPLRPDGWLVVIGLLVIAGWIVLCAGSGAALFDASGRRPFVAVAYAEIAVVAMLVVLATVTSMPLPVALPLPVLAALALAVPTAKLLLVGAPATSRWIAAGPRIRDRRPDPVAAHRGLATVTLAAIGLALTAVTLLAPVQGGDAGLGSASSDSVFHG
jgi:hypothetical protein